MSKYKFEELKGKKFGMLTITGPEERIRDKNGNMLRYVYCKCDCGNSCKFVLSAIMAGRALSCGCQMKKAREGIGERRKVAEYKKINTDNSRFKLRRVYDNILSRCYNRQNDHYYIYGAKNITVCNEWKYSFAEFYDWAINNGYKEGKVKLDRIDPNGNFEPKNCRWIPKNESHKNSDKRYIEYNGRNYNISETSEMLGCDYDILSNFCRNNYQYHDLGDIIEHANFIGYHREDKSQDALIFINRKEQPKKQLFTTKESVTKKNFFMK